MNIKKIFAAAGTLLILAGLSAGALGVFGYSRHTGLGAEAAERLREAQNGKYPDPAEAERHRRVFELQVAEAEDYKRTSIMIGGSGITLLIAGAVAVAAARRG